MSMFTLADELLRYYQRENHHILFKKDITLNECAIRMSELLHFHFDASTLSRVINGKRLFTPKQLQAFARVLELEKTERERLEKLLAHDVVIRYGISEDVMRKKSLYAKLLEYALDHSHTVSKNREQMVSALGVSPTRMITSFFGTLAKRNAKFSPLFALQRDALLCVVRPNHEFVVFRLRDL